MRVAADSIEPIDAWRAAQPEKRSRSEAIRRLVEEGLKAKRS